MDISQLNEWFPYAQQQPIIEQLSHRVGLTRIRAEYFVRLWIYLLVKEQQTTQQSDRGAYSVQPPLQKLVLPSKAMSCSHSEAAGLFYGDKDEGSDRSAGMMLDKLAALGLIKKHFDGNTTRIEIQPIPLTDPEILTAPNQKPSLKLDSFDPRCDAIPVANLLAVNYSWMNRTLDIVPHRITRLLRKWAKQYPKGMRVLRRTDNLNPVGFYLLYPTTADSEITFSSSPTKGLHLTSLEEEDPFTLATPKDPDCTAVFVRSWMIDPDYLDDYRVPFLQDAQATLRRMQEDFPNLCDLHTLIIHPSFETMAIALGFQEIGQHNSRDTQLCWMYQALDRYLALDIASIYT